MYSKLCESTITLGSGRESCEFREIRVERDGYQHCKDYHWRIFLDAEKKFSQFENTVKAKQISLKTCQSELSIMTNDFKKSERQLSIVTKYLQSTMSLYSLMKEKNEHLKKSLEEISHWQEDYIQKNMEMFSLIDLFISNLDDESIQKLDLDENVKMILLQMISRIKESSIDVQENIDGIITIFDGVNKDFILSKNSYSFLFKLKKYMELRKECHHSDLNFQSYAKKMETDYLQLENDTTKVKIEISHLEQEKIKLENDLKLENVKNIHQSEDCSNLSNDLTNISFSREQAENERNILTTL